MPLLKGAKAEAGEQKEREVSRIKKEEKDGNRLEEYREKVYEEFEQTYGIKHQEGGEYKTDNDW